MSDFNNDPLIDACLDEVLGDKQPPDLTARILAAWKERQGAGTAAGDVETISVTGQILDSCLDEVVGGQTPPDLTSAIVPALNQSPMNAVPAGNPMAPVSVDGLTASSVRKPHQQPRTANRRRSSREMQTLWISIAAAVTIIVVGSAIVMQAWDSSPIEREAVHQNAPTPQPNNRRTPTQTPPLPPLDLPIRDVAVDDEPSTEMTPEPVAPVPEAVEVVQAPTVEEQQPRVNLPAGSPPPARLASAEVIATINARIEAAWVKHEVTASSAVDDQQWIRRVYLRLIGREPDDRESTAFVSSKQRGKRADVVQTLLASDEFKPEFVRRWSSLWTESLLAGRGDEGTRRGLERFLRQSLADGAGFDTIARELLTATGSGDPGSDQFNGAANFLLAHEGADAVAATIHTSRVLLASSVQCAQCHAHSTNDQISQAQFWGLNAFFRQLHWQRDSDGARSLTDRDFSGEGDAEIYYSQPDGVLRVAYPSFPGYDDVPRSGRVQEVNRRQWLAECVTRSDQFAQATVNRVWAQLLGRGFTMPVGDIGAHNPPSHPELLDELADQLVAHDYDLRELMRWIVLSEPFARAAEARESTETSLFATYPSRESAPKPSLAESLKSTAQMLAAGPTATQGTAARVNATEPNPDAILQLTPDLASSRLRAVDPLDSTRGFGRRILDSELTVTQKIDHIFYALLHRSPTSGERRQVNRMLEDDRYTESEVLQRLWRAIGSSEDAHAR